MRRESPVLVLMSLAPSWATKDKHRKQHTPATEQCCHMVQAVGGVRAQREEGKGRGTWRTQHRCQLTVLGTLPSAGQRASDSHRPHGAGERSIWSLKGGGLPAHRRPDVSLHVSRASPSLRVDFHYYCKVATAPRAPASIPTSRNEVRCLKPRGNPTVSCEAVRAQQRDRKGCGYATAGTQH